MKDAREALEAAFDEYEEEQAAADPGEVDEPVPEEPADTDTAEASEDVDADEPEDEPDVDVAEEEPSDTPPPDVRAPQSWKPASREVWATVPEPARQEILRRENEIVDKLRKTAEERKSYQRFQQSIEPFKQTIAIEAGGDPIAAASNLMGVATRLRFGTQNEKAQLLAQIINQYGVDIDALDSALVGESPSPSQKAAPQPVADPRVDQLWQQTQYQQEQTRAQRMSEIQAFMADPKNEFANDVRDDMADVFDIAQRRGESLTLKQAYDRALSFRPDIQQVVQSRTAQPRQTPQESLKRKKRASKQIQGGMAATPAPSNERPSIADSIRQAMSSLADGD